MPKAIETTKLRTNLASAISEINQRKDFFIITRGGNPVAGLVDLDTLEDIEALASKEFIKSIREAKAQIKKGQFYTHDQVFGDI